MFFTKGEEVTVVGGAQFSCPLCNSIQLERRYPIDVDYAESLSGLPLPGLCPMVAVCHGCGHQFIHPSPSNEFVNAYYSNYMNEAKLNLYRDRDADLAISNAFRERYGRWLHQIAMCVKGRKLLDVGSGLGMFLRLSREFGFKSVGVEPSEFAAAQTREKLGFHMYQASLETADIRETFDVVTLWDLLEHLKDPMIALRKIRSLLAPGGIVVIEVPVRDSLFHIVAKLVYRVTLHRVRGPLYSVCGTHHLHYFSCVSIKDILERSGFRVIMSYADETELEPQLRKGAQGISHVLRDTLYNLALRILYGLARGTGRQNKRVLFARVD